MQLHALTHGSKTSHCIAEQHTGWAKKPDLFEHS